MAPEYTEAFEQALSLDWVGGFYDAEGAISIHVRRYSIDIQASFTQAYRPLLAEVQLYFKRQGIAESVLYEERRRQRIYRLVFSSNDGVVQMLLHLLPVLTLKKRQAQATIEYLTDRITGSEFLSIMNKEIDAGRKRGKKHFESQPWTRRQGIEKARLSSMSLARSVYQSMRRAPNFRQLEREHAIARNRRRGERTLRAILILLTGGPVTPSDVAKKISQTRCHARMLLKELYERSPLTRSRTRVTTQFEYSLSRLGHEYLERRV
ncbi:MAG TPA: LAGLIDADG family homing endonuclease [Nitrososphaerales archaeon]|nr:LAGLIDADG family homing endonuclease [Nitrososphaerales archaeon]